MCIRCHDKPVPGEHGYCAECVLAVREEIERGLVELTDYLRGWAAYSDWCAARGRAA